MKAVILGGGVTGLAAGMTSGLPVYEAEEMPGGICSSYYVRPDETVRHHKSPREGNAYRFEIGGGHWIFGGDPTLLHFLNRAAPGRRHARMSGVWFPPDGRYVPYPLQNHLRHLGEEIASKALREMISPTPGPYRTMEDWLYGCFGPTLCAEFFVPFHKLYTAGLYRELAPQDAYKSPVNLSAAVEGAFGTAPAVGYNVTFLYPSEGLDSLARRMATQCEIHYCKRVTHIDVRQKVVQFGDGTSVKYQHLLCTLPLNKTMAMAGLEADAPCDPHTSVLVLNIGGIKGSSCPADHWLYHPVSRSGFHRVGVYSNVDESFVPQDSRKKNDRVSFYVERAFLGGNRPEPSETECYGRAVVDELKEWEFLESADVVDPTWIDVAYTWTRPDSNWRQQALAKLAEHDIFMVGRYARWTFQGIADSIRDGFYSGACFRENGTPNLC